MAQKTILMISTLPGPKDHKPFGRPFLFKEKNVQVSAVKKL